MTEIFDCVQLLGFQTALEFDKAYCRDYWQRGRIRIRLFDSDKNPFREDIPSRKFAIVALSLAKYSVSTRKVQADRKW